MTQKLRIYIIKRWVEIISADRFVILQLKTRNTKQKLLPLILILSLLSCGEPEIRLSRADLRTVDTLVNQQLDSISPILDSLCVIKKDTLIQYWADSIMKERKKQEERLRLKIPQN